MMFFFLHLWRSEVFIYLMLSFIQNVDWFFFHLYMDCDPWNDLCPHSEKNIVKNDKGDKYTSFMYRINVHIIIKNKMNKKLNKKLMYINYILKETVL